MPALDKGVSIINTQHSIIPNCEQRQIDGDLNNVRQRGINVDLHKVEPRRNNVGNMTIKKMKKINFESRT